MAISSQYFVDPMTPFSLLGTSVLLLLLLVWLILAGTLALRGENVDMPNRVAQLYGYTVCLVAIIVGLITVSSLLNAAFDRVNPLQSEYSYGATLTSFEAYKATYPREQMMFARGSEQPDTLPEAALRERYDALVADRLATVRYRSAKTFTTSGLLLVFAIGLFTFHWRWVRRLRNGANAAV